MPLHRRHLYLAATIIGFLLLAPVLYRAAQGERFDWQTRRFVQTGVLVVLTEPRGATVTLSGHTVNARTPVKIPAIYPGRYHLTLTKAGFGSWEKEIAITGAQSTIIEGVVLPLDPPTTTTISVGLFAAAAVSPDGLTMATATLADRAILINRVGTNGERHRSASLPPATTIRQFSFSPSGRKILVATDRGAWTLPADFDREATPLPPTDSAIERLWWQADNENTLFGATASTLVEVDTFTNATSTILARPVIDLLADGNRLYLLVPEGEKTNLLLRTNRTEPQLVAQVPGIGWSFLPDPAQTIRLRSADGVVTSFTNDGRPLDDPAFRGKRVPRAVRWSPTGDRSIAIDGSEVWVGTRDRDAKILIGRYSEPIRDARFLLNDNTVLLTFADRLVLSEVDDRQGRRSVLVTSGGLDLELLGATDHDRALLLWDRGANPQAVTRLQLIP